MTNQPEFSVDIQKFMEIVVTAALTNGLVPKSQASTLREDADKQMIVVAAAPKSGSTFLSGTLSILTGFKYFRLCSAYSTNEHDLYLPALCMMNPYGCVSQLHMKGTFHNAAIMKTFGIKPIVLVRKIYDVVVSLKHDLRQKEQMSGYGTGLNGYSFLWQDTCTKSLSDEKLIDAIIDLAIPWYVNFYASWHRLCERGAVEAIWITYEELISEKEQTIRKIMSFLGYPNIGEIDQNVLSKKYNTFRSGESDQGTTSLTSAQKTRIKGLFAYYRDIDFSMFGV